MPVVIVQLLYGALYSEQRTACIGGTAPVAIMTTPEEENTMRLAACFLHFTP
jgi:hypothetical protein